MKLTAVIKLLPSETDASALRMTLERCNDAASWLARQGFENGAFRKFDLHRLAYSDLRQRFDLTAQAAVRVIAKVADTFKINRKVAPVFRADAAQPYDDRIIRFVKGADAVNLWTVCGRLTIPVVMGEHHRRLLTYRKGEIDLCFVRSKWYLAATCDVPETTEFEAEDWLGVDLGIVNLAADSDGTVYVGDAVEKVRRRLADRRKGLQRRGTKAAKRRLRKLAGRERRFRSHTNHVISKAIVANAERTGRGIALEDLTHIRSRVTARRNQRSRLYSWAFGQLRQFVAYKAKRAGVPVLFVDARYTSQTCSCCGCIDKRNRPDQATFSCVSCGHREAADTNAARVIRARAAVTRPECSQAVYAA